MERKFALKAHGTQLYGEFPYSKHLDDVARIVAPFGSECVRLAYLHDVKEDADVTIEIIKELFGDHTGNSIALLSDEEGASRKIRKTLTYTKMKLATEEFNDALIVKVADRLANVISCIETENFSLLKMYQKEHDLFKDSVFRPGLCDNLWTNLDELLNDNQPVLELWYPLKL